MRHYARRYPGITTSFLLHRAGRPINARLLCTKKAAASVKYAQKIWFFLLVMARTLHLSGNKIRRTVLEQYAEKKKREGGALSSVHSQSCLQLPLPPWASVGDPAPPTPMSDDLRVIQAEFTYFSVRLGIRLAPEPYPPFSVTSNGANVPTSLSSPVESGHLAPLWPPLTATRCRASMTIDISTALLT